jgi:murein DD-endopeptidase MepM/ murein hydrolase activator NlpD
MSPPQVTSSILLMSCALMIALIIPPRLASPPLTPDQQVAAKMATFQPRELIIPVANAPPGALADTWGDARSGGRTHQGIDIMAAEGTPVLAAANGTLVRFFDSERGGITIYQFDEREQFVFYYAHLSARADVREGQTVRQGDVIGFVGQTGNAPVPHLHFEIQRLTPERKWWQAEALNPYPYLLSGRAPH